MSKRLVSIVGGIVLALTTAGLALGQNTQTTGTTTTTVTGNTVTQTTQNADGSWTVVEYPVGKEVMVNLMPSATLPGATGTAKIMRMANGTTINLDLSGLSGDMSNLNLYAVDPNGRVTMLGPVSVNNGTGTFSATTTAPLDRFMLVLSPESNLTTYTPTTNVLLRSAVPQGYAVVPLASHGERDGAAVGERVAATTTANTASAYSAPLLGIPGFCRGATPSCRSPVTERETARRSASVSRRRRRPTRLPPTARRSWAFRAFVAGLRRRAARQSRRERRRGGRRACRGDDDGQHGFRLQRAAPGHSGLSSR